MVVAADCYPLCYCCGPVEEPLYYSDEPVVVFLNATVSKFVELELAMAAAFDVDVDLLNSAGPALIYFCFVGSADTDDASYWSAAVDRDL